MADILRAIGNVDHPEGWSTDHTQALILTIYDTSHRVGALLKLCRDQLDRNGRLHALAEQTKQKSDTVHQLHSQTLAAIAGLKRTKRLFPWPRNQRAIYPFLRRILQAAGLPATRRDLFHKFRRTSYTMVYALAGPDSASRHAGHATNLAKSYLDVELAREIRGDKSPIELMPRLRSA